MLVLDSLNMVVTSDPSTEIEAALARTVQALRAARSSHDRETADRLSAWIDHRLDELCEFGADHRAGDQARGHRDRG